MRVTVMDLETIPCLQVARRLWGIDPDAPDAFDQVLAKRREETEGKSDFLKPFMHQVVAVGLVGLNLSTDKVEIAAFAGPEEPHWIREADVYLKGRPTLVGWNTLGFDLPVLTYRAMYHRLAMPNLHSGLKSFEKYGYRFGDYHYDMMDVLSGFGRSTNLTLSEAAALCDLPCKQEGSGDQVLDRWRRGEVQQIRAYVREDVVTTARLFLRWWHSRGMAFWESLEDMDQQLAGLPPQLAVAS